MINCVNVQKSFGDKKVLREMLGYVGLADAEKRAAANLSKGMEARLRLARVFMHSPKIIFLDEPTSGLDPMSMRAIHRLIHSRIHYKKH